MKSNRWKSAESADRPKRTNSESGLHPSARRQASSGKRQASDTLASAIEAAEQVAARAYCPYSKFPVGAALVGKSGQIYTGCNVENSSLGLTICAERTAIFKAVSEGEREFDLLVIYTPTQTLTGPCGACRQVMAEFAPNLTVVMTNKTGRVKMIPLSRLLPAPFRF